MLIRFLFLISATLSIGTLRGQTTLNASRELVSRGAAAANLVPNQTGLDSGPLLLAAIEYAKANQVTRVIVDPGSYYFATLQFTDRHVNLFRANNITLDFQGSDLIFSQVQRIGLVCEQCTNFVIQNFRMDYAQLPFTQLRVTSVDAGNRVLRYTTEPGWQDPSVFNTIRNSFGLPENVYLFVFRNGQPAADLSRMEVRRPLGGGQLVIANNGVPWEAFGALQRIRVGDVAVLAARASGEPLMLSLCTGCTVRNGRIYSSGINGVRLIGCRGTLVERVYVMPKPGTDRLVSANADGVAVAQPGPDNVVRLSRAIRTMDDGFSPNSLVFGTVTGVQSSRVIWVQRQYDLGIQTPSPVTFQRRSDGVELGTAVVTAQSPDASMTPTFGQTVSVTLDRDAPANVVGAVIYTTDPNQRGTGFVVERNTVQDQVFARGISLWGLMNSAVRGNYIWRSQMAAILGTHRLMTEDWMSPPLNGVTVSNNVVDGANTKFGTGVLDKFAGFQILAQRQDFQPMLGSPHRNVTSQGNFVADPSRSGIRVENTTTGAVVDNRLVNPSNNPFMEGYWEDTFEPYLTEFRRPVVIKSSTGVTESGTVVEQGAERVVVSDGLFQRLAAYGPGATVRLNGWNVGQSAGPTVTLRDADGVVRPVTVATATTHALNVVVPAGTALGGAVITVVAGGRTLVGTLFIDGEDNIPAVNGCTYDAVPSANEAGGGAGVFGVLVVTQAGCPQLVRAVSSFATVGAVGTGAGPVELTLTANRAGLRTLEFEVGGWPVRVGQQANPSVTQSGAVSGSGASKTFEFRFQQAGGFQKLGILNVLINGALDGGRACYIAYSQPAGILFLVKDGGVGEGLSEPLTLGSAGAVSNGQCRVNGTGSSAVGSGDTLVLRLNITFLAGFAGSQVVYLAARDQLNGNSGWSTMGFHAVPGGAVTFPNAVGMSPESLRMRLTPLTFTYEDQTSAANIQTAWVLINGAVDGRGACYVAFFAPGNLLLLVPDDGDGSKATAMALPGTGTLQNSQCVIHGQQGALQSTVTRTGNRLVLSLVVEFRPEFAGNKGVWLALQTLSAVTSRWKIAGGLEVF